MVLIYFFLAVSLIWLAFASISDIRKREVPDWLSYSLIGIGLGTRLLYSTMFSEYKVVLFGLLGLAICFIFGNLMYYTKQWGGGDAKLIMGLGAMFADYKISLFSNFIELPFLLILVINIFLTGSIYGIFYSFNLALKNKEKFVGKWKERKQHGLLLALFLGLIIVITSYFMLESSFKIVGIFSGVLFVILYFLIIFIKTVESSCLINFVDVNKLTEGDWLVKNVIVKGKLICKARGLGLTLEDIKNLKKHKLKKVLIKDGMPFVPGFFFGLLLTILISLLL